MTPNNNFSVLPWYSSLEQQNARKWWAYGRVYPLFTPKGYLLPFQLLREQRLEEHIMTEVDVWDDAYIDDDGQVAESPEYNSSVSKYDVSGGGYLIFRDYNPGLFDGFKLLAILDGNDEVIDTVDGDSVPAGDYKYELPEGASTALIVIITDLYGGLRELYGIQPITSFVIYNANTNVAVTGNIVSSLYDAGLAIKNIPIFEKDAIVFTGLMPYSFDFPIGRYYAEMSDGEETWYSEVFTSVDCADCRLKIEWWDEEDFYMDAGVIVYKNPTFKNVLYLCSDVAKPEYIFEEEGEERDGYFFPEKQISEKRYHFQFLAPEYLLDVMRFIRMADHIKITKGDDEYSVDTFLMTPEWVGDGDVASVDIQFDTATVAKKIGKGYLRARRGDFNDDFNTDFDTI